MHELAGCRLLAGDGLVDGYVTEYASGVLRMQLEQPLLSREVGDHVTVQVLDPVRGECTYRGLLARTAGVAVDVVVLEAVGQRQRRSAARAAYQVTCVGIVDPKGDAQKLPLTVLDVSATGLRFAAKRKVPEGTVVLVRLPADGGVLELRARVVRAEEGRVIWRHGAELLAVPDATRERLYRLVMRLQREELRRAAQERDD